MGYRCLQEVFKKYYAILFYLIFAILITFTISLKSYNYIDDYFAYNLANTQNSMATAFANYVVSRTLVKDDVKYTPASDFYARLTSVQANKTFDYANVWRNQAEDTHPPLHYALLHTVCSFFPSQYSKWFAGIINLIFSLLLLLVARKLMRLLTDDESVVGAVSLIIVCSSALLNANAFFRMYIMAMFFVVVETYIVCEWLSKKPDSISCFMLFIATLAGGLTHYYCALYTVIISTIYALYLIKDRDWKKLCWFSLIQVCAAVSTCVIYPPVIYNVLRFGLNGNAAVYNLSYTEAACYSELLLYYIQLISQQWFGGLFPVIFFAMIFFAVSKIHSNMSMENNDLKRRYTLIFMSAIIYCVLVSARTMRIKWNYISMDFRYLHPVWITTLCGCFVYFLTNAKEYISQHSNTKHMKYIQLLFVFAVILGTFHYTDWNGRNLYRAYNTYEYVRKPYYNADCIVLTGDTISSYTAFEMSGYKSLTWLKLAKTTPERLRQLATGNKFVVCVETFDAQADEIIMQVMKILPEFKISVKLPMFANLPDFERPGNIYYLDRVVSK